MLVKFASCRLITIHHCEALSYHAIDEIGFVAFVDQPNLIFMQYTFDGIEHAVKLSSHGNSKHAHSSAYVRTTLWLFY